MKMLVLASDEVWRLLSTRRGMLSLAGFFLVWFGVLVYGIIPAAKLFSGAAESGLTELFLPGLGLESWQQWSTPEFVVYWGISLYLLPFLTILTAADQTASDRARGTLRYLALRCGRLEIFFGRYVGQLIILTMVILVTMASVLSVVAFNSPDRLPDALAHSPIIIVNLVLVLAPYIALMALVSVLAKSARQATQYAIIVWFALWLLVKYFKLKFPEMQLLDWAMPGSQVSQLLRLSDWQTLTLAPIPIVHTVILLAIGAFFMRQRDL